MLDSPTGIDNTGVAQWGAADSSIVVFFRGSRKNDVRSKAEGTEIHDDIDMIKVIHPGENDGHGVETEAQPWHKARWPRQWEAYQKNIEFRVEGTPLELLFPTSPATVKMLHAKNVFVVQQLANLNDEVISRNPMFRDLKTRASQYLSAARKGVEHHELVAVNEKLTGDLGNAQSDIAELKSQIAALQAAMATPNTPRTAGEVLEAEPVRRGPGQPPKAKPEIPAAPAANPYDPESYLEGE